MSSNNTLHFLLRDGDSDGRRMYDAPGNVYCDIDRTQREESLRIFVNQ